MFYEFWEGMRISNLIQIIFKCLQGVLGLPKLTLAFHIHIFRKHIFELFQGDYSNELDMEEIIYGQGSTLRGLT
jgi:hypothetical protein